MTRHDPTSYQVGESAMRIAIAGFGGALAGLSVSRRRGTFGASSASVVKKTIKPYVDQDLPATWAMACLGFASIVEFSRWISPTSLMLDAAQGFGGWKEAGESVHKIALKDDPSQDSTGVDPEPKQPQSVSAMDWKVYNPIADTPWDQAARTVGDYMIGGAFAGMAFRGLSVQTKAGARLAARGVAGVSPPVRAAPNLLGGMGTGAALGLVAGVVVFGLDAAQNWLEEMQEEEQSKATKEEGPKTQQGGGLKEEEEDVMAQIRAEVKGMSTEQISRQIEELRGSRPTDPR